MNKDAIKDGLLKFFGGDEVKVEGGRLMLSQDNLKVKESTSISLTGIKEKPSNEDK